jgi:hypothetical protein
MIHQFNNSVSIGGNAIGNNISTGGNIQGSPKMNIGSEIQEKQQLKQDLQQLKDLLQKLEANNPQASAHDKQTFLTAGTQPSTRKRLVAAFVAGGKAAIEDFLENPYVNVVVAAIEGWKS